jgi:hypothetical protein
MLSSFPMAHGSNKDAAFGYEQKGVNVNLQLTSWKSAGDTHQSPSIRYLSKTRCPASQLHSAQKQASNLQYKKRMYCLHQLAPPCPLHQYFQYVLSERSKTLLFGPTCTTGRLV